MQMLSFMTIRLIEPNRASPHGPASRLRTSRDRSEALVSQLRNDLRRVLTGPSAGPHGLWQISRSSGGEKQAGRLQAAKRLVGLGGGRHPNHRLAMVGDDDGLAGANAAGDGGSVVSEIPKADGLDADDVITICEY
jgi:hypothetical protein